MLIAILPAYTIRAIADLSKSDTGARIAFQDGSICCLEASHPHFDHLLWLAQWSRSSRPVGVATDATGCILDRNVANDTGVAWIREFPTEPSRFRVAFWAYSPICGLTREHPEFDRLHATLTVASGMPQPLWVATHSEETVNDEPDEEGLIAALPKIMDVRPL